MNTNKIDRKRYRSWEDVHKNGLRTKTIMSPRMPLIRHVMSRKKSPATITCQIDSTTWHSVVRKNLKTRLKFH